MAVVRQAHLPGNYELYEEDENRLGPPVCKICWERFQKQNPDSLGTVWVVSEGRRMVWLLCGSHEASVGNEGRVQVIRSSPGIVPSPGI